MEGEQNNVNMDKEGGGSAGPIIGIIVILVIIILGGLYFWSQREGNDTTINDATINDATITDEALESINLQSGLDDTTSIEADLDATDIENLDAELNAS